MINKLNGIYKNVIWNISFKSHDKSISESKVSEITDKIIDNINNKFEYDEDDNEFKVNTENYEQFLDYNGKYVGIYFTFNFPCLRKKDLENYNNELVPHIEVKLSEAVDSLQISGYMYPESHKQEVEDELIYLSNLEIPNTFWFRHYLICEKFANEILNIETGLKEETFDNLEDDGELANNQVKNLSNFASMILCTEKLERFSLLKKSRKDSCSKKSKPLLSLIHSDAKCKTWEFHKIRILICELGNIPSSWSDFIEGLHNEGLSLRILSLQSYNKLYDYYDKYCVGNVSFE